MDDFWATGFWAEGFWAEGFWANLGGGGGPVLPPGDAGGKAELRIAIHVGL